MKDIETLCRTPLWARELRADMAYWQITNTDLAAKIGISGAFMGMILSGVKKPSEKRKEEIIKAENQIRESRKKAEEKWRAKNGGE